MCGALQVDSGASSNNLRSLWESKQGSKIKDHTGCDTWDGRLLLVANVEY